MWLDGSLYVAAPPQHLEADRHRRRRRRRQARRWFQGKTLTGCANDLHGPYLGPRRLDLLVQGGVRQADLRRCPARSRSSRAPSHIFRAGPTARASSR